MKLRRGASGFPSLGSALLRDNAGTDAQLEVFLTLELQPAANVEQGLVEPIGIEPTTS